MIHTPKQNMHKNQMETSNVCVIGGGIAGLYSALQLLSLTPYHVHIIEKNNYLGGRIKTIQNKTKQSFQLIPTPRRVGFKTCRGLPPTPHCSTSSR